MSTPTHDERADGQPVGATPVPPQQPAPAASAQPKSPLATSAMVIGIVAIVCAVIPGLSLVAFLPAIAATVLGIIALATKKPRRGRALTGVILGPIALVVAIIVSIVVIFATVNTIQDAGVPEDSALAEAEEATPDPEEVEDPEPDVVPDSIVYEGSGDSVLPISLPDGAGVPAIATITHAGSRYFGVWALDSGMNQSELMVNTVGEYQGTVLFNSRSSVDTTSLEISADGAWTVTVHSVLSIRGFDGPVASGVGDDVVIYRGGSGAASISHDGDNHFAIWSYGERDDLIVNEIGQYTGTTRWTAGPSVVVVTADGNWSIAVE